MTFDGHQKAGIALGTLTTVYVLGFLGFFPQSIAFLNENQGAVMGVAALITACATVALVFLNRASWRLYEREMERDEANRVRLTAECERAKRRIEFVQLDWEQVLATRDEPIQQSFLLNHALDRTRDLLSDLEPDVARWIQEARRPDVARRLGGIKQSIYTARAVVPTENQDPTRHDDPGNLAERINVVLDVLKSTAGLALKVLDK